MSKWRLVHASEAEADEVTAKKRQRDAEEWRMEQIRRCVAASLVRVPPAFPVGVRLSRESRSSRFD
jgi:hypothetical protein